jgi:hypothetical protein
VADSARGFDEEESESDEEELDLHQTTTAFGEMSMRRKAKAKLNNAFFVALNCLSCEVKKSTLLDVSWRKPRPQEF